MTTPADELRTAAEKIRELIDGVPRDLWGDRPWHVEACSDKATGDCPCIVTQGEYKPFDQPQVPMIQYVADAETTGHANYIAAMHPGVGLALADWLESTAESLDSTTHPGWQETVAPHALAVARAINGGQP